MSRFVFGLLIGAVSGYLYATRLHLMTSASRQLRDLMRRTAADELDSLSRDELYQRAQAEDVPGRSNMSKEELRDALVADDTEAVEGDAA
jgi:hypothetical protein